MRKLLQIVIFSLLVTGCVGPVKQSWSNFTAYYNTFHNAKKYYAEGEELNIRQSAPINSRELIQIYQRSSTAGHEEFDEAITRSAAILRKHDDSKFVTPALLIIGKAYYYKSEYFSAIETFSELRALTDGREYQESIIWEARTLFEMGNYEDGLRLINLELDYIQDWEPSLLGELYAISGQLHANSGNWESASRDLLFAEEIIEDPALKARVFFLHGQVLERMNNTIQARAAYRFASNLKSDYDVEFHSQKKQADLARQAGDYTEALSLYRKLQRDDKFVDYSIEMKYELARTNQIMGNSEQAIDLYNSLLHHRFDVPDDVTRARSYFGMGEIYRDEIDNFTLAAAYFDSAASLNVEQKLISDRYDAAELAASFGEYSSLKNQIANKDSLLMLASLSPAEFDSVIAIIRQNLDIEQRQLESDAEQDNLLIAAGTVDASELADAAQTTEFGFLNHRNRAMLADASLQFQAVWGDRPLEDNWRRRTAIGGSRFDQMEGVASENNGNVVMPAIAQNGSGSQFAPDLSEIPFDEEQQIDMKKEIENLKYRLANLFLLSLDMPDSARFYYEGVLQSGLNPSVAPRSVFSLIDLDMKDGNEILARNRAHWLVREYPDSPYARQIADQFDFDIQSAVEFTDDEAVEDLYLAIQRTDTTLAPEQRAVFLHELANRSDNPSQKSVLLYDAARNYLEAALNKSDNRENIYNWITNRLLEEERLSISEAVKDSTADIILENELLDEEKHARAAFLDSSFLEPQSSRFPFKGEYWDSTRSLLKQVEVTDRAGRFADAARSLLELINEPDSVRTEPIKSMPFPEDRFPTDPGPDMNRCLDAGLAPDFPDGLKGFMRLITFPDWAIDAGLRTEITYRITVSADGEVKDYTQVSNMDRNGIPEAIEDAIENSLRFKPLGGSDSYRCEITFNIDI